MVDSVDNSFWAIDILGSWIEVGMVLIVVMAGLAIGATTINSSVKNKKKIINPCASSYREQHTRIHEFLTEIRVKLGAERAAVLQFHNGGNFLDGSSMKKFSLTHESCVVGVSESMGSRQNLQVTAFMEMLEILSRDQASVEITSSLPDCHLKRHLEANHTLVYSMLPLKNARGVLTVGCLLVEWCNWDKADELDDDLVTLEMPQFARYIEGQMIGANIHG